MPCSGSGSPPSCWPIPPRGRTPSCGGGRRVGFPATWPRGWGLGESAPDSLDARGVRHGRPLRTGTRRSRAPRGARRWLGGLPRGLGSPPRCVGPSLPVLLVLPVRPQERGGAAAAEPDGLRRLRRGGSPLAPSPRRTASRFRRSSPRRWRGTAATARSSPPTPRAPSSTASSTATGRWTARRLAAG